MPETESRLPGFIEDPFKAQIDKIVDFTDQTEEFFPGDTVANLTPEQLAALEATQGTATDVTGFNVDARNSNAFLSDTAQLFADPLGIPGVKNFQDMVISDASKRLGESLLPQVRSSSILSGAFGGSRNQIGEGLAAERVADQAEGTLADFGVNLFANLLGANTAALDRVPALTDSAFIGSDKAFEAGKVLKDQDQAEIDAERERFEFERDETLRDVNAVIDVLGGQNIAGGMGTVDTGSPDFLSQILGGLTTILGTEAGAGFFEDIIRGIPDLFGGDDPGTPSTDIDPSQP